MTSTTAVLITGTSSGIGWATAERLARRNDLTVYATARRTETLADLAAAGAHILALDVTDESSMTAAVQAIEERHQHVGVLINNAGYGAYGTIEETALHDVRRQFETNVFGLARMTQLVLPAMRTARQGRIINIGSMGGRLVFPVGGYYHASKYAVEALTDALRFEAAPFGVKVSLIEPGLIRTGFGDVAARTQETSTDPLGPYAALSAANEQQMRTSYESTMLSASPELVAKTIERAATVGHPRARYVITPAAKTLIHTRRLLGARVFDAYLKLQYRRSF
ncbi:oxidoreductase [Streptomyces sp. NBC_00687]|uniref:oxidoreductase n=1 Tax=Streptomyces sp. NBC_00687 TaxID=2975807 RepID=UPI0022579F2C|nr:oxidoreductase [Streptomyces sp. NBC_00687]MCX4918919.1 oxidoreductase [Streptomyces sp. NBC_00687]